MTVRNEAKPLADAHQAAKAAETAFNLYQVAASAGSDVKALEHLVNSERMVKTAINHFGKTKLAPASKVSRLTELRGKMGTEIERLRRRVKNAEKAGDVVDGAK